MKPEEVRHHYLKILGTKNPATARYVMDNEKQDGQELASGAIGLGLGTHALVLENRPVVAYPGTVRRGKEWEAFQVDHAGDIIMTATDYDKAARMADAVRNHKDATALLTGVREQTIHWTWLGRKCRTTPDVAGPGYVTELKTTVSADPFRFQSQALRYGYHAQLAWQGEAIRTAGIGEVAAYYIVAVESAPPYPVTVLKLTDRAIDAGARLNRMWMEQFVSCEAADHWPGYVESIVDMDVPDDLELTFGDEEAA